MFPTPIAKSAFKHLKPYVEAHEDRFTAKGLNKKFTCEALDKYREILHKLKERKSGEKEKYLEETEETEDK